ncbi:hypothetical protein GCM10023149_39960 [Mucilaginibacter gynuensis]|uniref:Tetratricopeptide repeat protein n=1 Tax=Mucilaginibacter gynuensis TaxID=1302236 RepID=A0ABP8H2P6_9SPHI
MKKLLTLITIIIAVSIRSSAIAGDTDTLRIGLDSLKQQLQLTTNDSLKGPIYIQIAGEYMLQYDSLLNKRQKLNCQNEALNYTYQALHVYSKYSDTTGLRTSFDNLAKIYHTQKKYSQAKWFILQSNTLSRMKNDTANIITSLIKLAAIKTDIKDYTLAMRDLNEALELSTHTGVAPKQAVVQKSYARLYTKMKDKKKASIALRKSKLLSDTLRINSAKTLSIADNQPVKKKALNKRTAKPVVTKKLASI